MKKRRFEADCKEIPYDTSSDHYFVLEERIGVDAEGVPVWATRFKHHDRNMVLRYAGLYLAGKYCRLVHVERELPGLEAGTIHSEVQKTVPDGYEGLIGKLNL